MALLNLFQLKKKQQRNKNFKAAAEKYLDQALGPKYIGLD